MHFNCYPKLTAVLKSSFLILTCLFLVMSLSLAGCSKKEKKEQPEKKKQVVTEMNITKEEDTPKKPKKDEVESLPLESEDEEEQLPVLGSGG